MHRLGRDNVINNFNSNEHDHDSILIFNYGEIDCRCHIQKQINAGGNKDEIINIAKSIKSRLKQYRNEEKKEITFAKTYKKRKLLLTKGIKKLQFLQYL